MIHQYLCVTVMVRLIQQDERLLIVDIDDFDCLAFNSMAVGVVEDRAFSGGVDTDQQGVRFVETAFEHAREFFDVENGVNQNACSNYQ